jgi:hypothetical protein
VVLPVEKELFLYQHCIFLFILQGQTVYVNNAVFNEAVPMVAKKSLSIAFRDDTSELEEAMTDLIFFIVLFCK